MTANSAAIEIISRARAAHAGLKHHRILSGSLAPSATTNRIFAELVQLALHPANANLANSVMDDLSDDAVLHELYQLCAQGEYQMEHHWSERIRTAVQPMAELRRFPYWQNYLKLARLEVQALRQSRPGLKRVLFVGAGPLPLTAFIMAKHYGLDVTNLDIDGDATCCAAAWMERILGVASLPCHHIDVLDFTDFSEYDAIVLAALVGLDSTAKQRVLQHLHTHMQPEQILLVRSVAGLRRLLYPEVTKSDLPGFTLTRAIHPRGEVVNSILLARKTT